MVVSWDKEWKYPYLPKASEQGKPGEQDVGRITGSNATMRLINNSDSDGRGVWRRIILLTISVAVNAPAIAANGDDKLETRCGWFWNPTPANMWLVDRDGEWTIGTMGGHQAKGEWNWPKFKEGEWIKTNRTYGYGCACFKLRVNKQTHDVLYIDKSWAKPLSACRNDPSIKDKPE